MTVKIKPIEQTREYRVRELYNGYVQQHTVAYAQWQPVKLEWGEAYAIYKRIILEAVKPITRASKIMQNGTRQDRTGVYGLDGQVYDFCEYTEHRGGMSNYICYRYENYEAWRNFLFPLPRHMWHE